jgi:hypothetical protein
LSYVLGYYKGREEGSKEEGGEEKRRRPVENRRVVFLFLRLVVHSGVVDDPVV